MPGMNSGLSPADPTLVAAFRSALLHQGAIALLIIVFLGLLWATARTWRVVTPAAKLGASGTAAASEAAETEQASGPAGTPAAGGRRLRAAGGGALGGTRDAARRRGRGAAGPVAVACRGLGAPGAGAAADRVRADLDPGRDLAGAAQDGGRAGLAGHRADRGGLAGLGAAPGQLGRDDLVLPPHPGRRGLGVDPGRDRRLAAGREERAVVQAGRAGQRGLGPGGVGVRGVVRRDLRTGPELAHRGAWRGADLRGGRGAHRAAGGRLAEPAARAPAARRDRTVLPRHGGAAGLAGPRLLEGPHQRPAGHPVRHGPADVLDLAAALPVRAAGATSARSRPATASR